MSYTCYLLHGVGITNKAECRVTLQTTAELSFHLDLQTPMKLKYTDKNPHP